MRKSNWKDTAELVGIAAIVASLMFVGLQMRQERVLARAELGSGGLETYIALRLHASDPNFSITYSKMLNQPSELTDSEMIQINNYLSAVLAFFALDCYLLEADVFGECGELFKVTAPFFFGSEYAKAWWRVSWIESPYTPAWMNDEVENLDIEVSHRMLGEIRDQL